MEGARQRSMRVRIDTAVIVCPRADVPEAGLLGIRVAGVPLLTRALLTAQRAGIERFTIVASGPQQVGLKGMLDGEARLRGRVQWREPAERFGPPSGSCLVLLPFVVLDARGLSRWLARVAESGSAAAPDGPGVGPLVVPAALLAPCIQAALLGEAGWMGFAEKLRGDGRLIRIPWEGMPLQPLRSVDEVPVVERAMLATVRSVEDGPIVDRYVNRAVSWRLTRWLAKWCVTPNQVTAASLATGLIGAWLLGGEGRIGSLAGLFLYQLSVILDHADGELARVKFLQSPLGKWLDNIGDHVVDLAIIGCLCWRVASQETAGYFAAVGLAAAVGVTSAFLVVFAWSISKQRREVGRTLLARLLARVLAFLANRDAFTVALWATVIVDRPAWFLWALALGANLYWVAWIFIFGLPLRARLAPGRVEEGS